MTTKRGRVVIGALIALGGVVAFGLTWIAAPPRAGSDWVVTQGRVVLIQDAPKDRSCRADAVKAPVFDYQTPAGVFSEVGGTWCNMGASVDTWRVGDITDIAYDPEAPADAVVVGQGAPPYPYAFLMVSTLAVILGAWVAWSGRGMA